MCLHTVAEVEEFKQIISLCKGKVWMEDRKGRSYNLKSEISQYTVIGIMLSDTDNSLELYASEPEDENQLISFLMRSHRKTA